VLVQRGTLEVGDSFICGLYDGRVRALLDERPKPSMPCAPFAVSSPRAKKSPSARRTRSTSWGLSCRARGSPRQR
jgi:translation initiation factor IF-2